MKKTYHHTILSVVVFLVKHFQMRVIRKHLMISVDYYLMKYFIKLCNRCFIFSIGLSKNDTMNGKGNVTRQETALNGFGIRSGRPAGACFSFRQSGAL